MQLIMLDVTLDFTSDEFSPMKALYSAEVVAPLPVRPLTSLSSCRVLLPPDHPDYVKRKPAGALAATVTNIHTTTTATVETPVSSLSRPRKKDILDEIAGVESYFATH